MKKRILLLLIIITLISICIYCLYYYYPRKISFELFIEIPKPTESYDNSQWLSYHYIQNEERLIYFLTDYYKQRYPPQQGYDDLFAYNVSRTFDFKNYDYIMVYQKQLKSLSYSPYLAKKEDGIGDCEKKKPLIPAFDTTLTDRVYIYRIKKNNKYRPPGP